MVTHKPEYFSRTVAESARPERGTVQRLYSSHILELLDPWASARGSLAYLANVGLLLAPGGVMRIVSASLSAPLSLLIPKQIEKGSLMHRYYDYLASTATPKPEHTEEVVAIGLYGHTAPRTLRWTSSTLRSLLLSSGLYEDVYSERLNISKYEEFRDLEKHPPIPMEIYEYETFVIEAVRR